MAALENIKRENLAGTDEPQVQSEPKHIQLSDMLSTLDMKVTYIQPEELKARLAEERNSSGSHTKECKVSSIGVIDDFEPEVIEQNAQRVVHGSHGELVVLAAKGNHPIVAYNASSSDLKGKVDNDTLLQALHDIRDLGDENCIKTANLSVSRTVSFERLNLMMEYAGAEFKEAAGILTPENISDKATIVRQAIEKIVADGPTLAETVRSAFGGYSFHNDMKESLEVSDAMRELAAKDISVVVSAGNAGPGHISMFSVLAPETITVCGASARGTKVDRESSFHGMVDVCEFMHTTVSDKNKENTVSVSGTSFAAPDMAQKIAGIRDHGVSAAKLNDIYLTNHDLIVPKEYEKK